MKSALRMSVGGVAALLLTIASRAIGQETATHVPDVHFVPTGVQVVTAMLDVAHVGPEDIVYDLGSGDGRIVIAAARRGATAIGIDIDPVRIKESRTNADTAGVGRRATFQQADLFETDLRPATVVTLYLLPSLNVRLIPKLYSELRPGTRVVSNSFDMGEWKPDTMFGVPGETGGTSTVYFWLLPADASGEWKLTTSDGPAYRLHLEQQYQQLTGTATASGRKLLVDSARLAGDRIEFALVDPKGADARAISFTGKLDDDEAKGTYVDHSGQSREWTASRISRGRGPIPKNDANADSLRAQP